MPEMIMPARNWQDVLNTVREALSDFYTEAVISILGSESFKAN